MKLAESKVEFDLDETGTPVGEPPALFPDGIVRMLEEEQKSCRIRITVVVEKVEAE